MDFPYQLFKQTPSPIIPFLVHHKNQKLKTIGLIDSGASISIFTYEVASLLQIDIPSGEKMPLEGVGGKIAGFIHTLNLETAGKKIAVPVVFSLEYKVSANLLGRLDFFENFKITFDEKNKLVELI